MRATIKMYERREKSGWFGGAKKLIEVSCKVDFTQEELWVIKEYGFDEFSSRQLILDRERPAHVKPDPDRDNEPYAWALFLHDLARPEPDTHTFHTPLDAKAYRNQLADALTQLKEFLDANMEIDTEEVTLEL